MKYRVAEWYQDCFCPSGENDEVVRAEIVEAASAQEARSLWLSRHTLGSNTVLKIEPA